MNSHDIPALGHAGLTAFCNPVMREGTDRLRTVFGTLSLYLGTRPAAPLGAP